MRKAAKVNRVSTKGSRAWPTNFHENQAHHECPIHPPFGRRHIRDVGDPDTIGGHGMWVVGRRGLPPSTAPASPNPGLSHEAGHPFPIHAPAACSQIGRHPLTPITAPMPPPQCHEQASRLLKFLCVRSIGNGLHLDLSC